MSVFDGLAGALATIFGAPVTITPERGLPATVQAILRENPREVMDNAGRPHWVDTPTLQVNKPIPDALAKGAIVTAASHPGVSFRVLGVYADRSPATDAFMVAELERVE